MLARVHDEQGAIVVTAAVLVVGFILLGSGIIQVGDWLQHRRHLQVRADAAALAGGQVFNECFDPIDYSTGQAQTDIENVARRYGGFASPGGDSYNGQIGSGSDSVVFQSAKYSDGAGGDDTQNG